MTEEAVERLLDAADTYVRLTKDDITSPPVALAWNDLRIAVMRYRAASNSPAANGEVSEPRQTHCADPDCTGPKPHVAETAGCKWGNPRAASDDAVGRIIEDLRDLKIVSPVLRFMGIGRRSRLIHEIHELANEAAAALAALRATPDPTGEKA